MRWVECEDKLRGTEGRTDKSNTIVSIHTHIFMMGHKSNGAPVTEFSYIHIFIQLYILTVREYMYL